MLYPVPRLRIECAVTIVASIASRRGRHEQRPISRRIRLRVEAFMWSWSWSWSWSWALLAAFIGVPTRAVAGVITGKVVFAGAVPPPKKLEATADQYVGGA